MTSSPENRPTGRCHNCRRQRLRCDRSYPQCNKCINAGKECLGYGTLYRWTGAVASRGKLAGRTSSAPWNETRSPSPPPSKLLQGESPNSKAENPGSAERSGQVSNDDASTSLVSMWRPASPHILAASPRALADPLYQDMQRSDWYYLSYFGSRVCRDLVSHDLPDQNPFRTLLPLTRAHPLLHHIIVAASAAHMANLVRAPVAFCPKSLEDGTSARAELAAHSAWKDSLLAKSKALVLMRQALENIATTGADVVLAAALFFINVELIESGKHGWRAHLEGVGRIMSLLQPCMATDSTLRDYVLSDCSIYFILGAAFMPASFSDAQSHFWPEHVPLLLQRAAANSYLCCPPEILTILYSASRLSNLTPEVASQEEDRVREAALVLLQKAQSFDIESWANSVRNSGNMQDISVESRIHVGSSHRLAACLYILQAIPSLSRMKSHDQIAKQLVLDIFEHLSSVPDEDPNFKATTWPTFIAGAEAADAARREWVMNRLQRLVVSVPWGFLYTAMETLQLIWNLDTKGKGEGSWVQALKDPDMNFLIV